MSRGIPAQLPANVDRFTGRRQELAILDRLLAEAIKQEGDAAGESTAVVIAVISGTAGVGKTSLALRWAHQTRSRYPDGQLYVNLRGYDPDQPMSAGDALASFLRALGMAEQEIPVEVEERAAAYRSLLTGRRVLVVLDNAATVEQIRPLLPGTASCVVVTSRDSLAGLVVRYGARRLDLEPLPPEDAVALLRTLIGERTHAEPEAAATLAEQCVRLPLALRVAAELAAGRPDVNLAELVTELGDVQQRLDLLDAGGDPRTAMRAVLSWSYQHLSVDAARMFRLIGLHPGPDLDPYAAAVLADVSFQRAQQLLDLLVRAHLIQLMRDKRYSMHDLLRAYAVHLATKEDPEQVLRSALTRLFDYYVNTAITATETLVSPTQNQILSRPEHRTIFTPLGTGPTAARVWLDSERNTLLAVTAYTATHGWPDYTIRLADILGRCVGVGGFAHWVDSMTMLEHARNAAHQINDSSAEARALASLGLSYFWQGCYQQAIEHHQQALTLYRELGDRVGEADVLTRLGLVYQQQGSHQQATQLHERALTIFRELGHRDGEANVLDDLGVAYWHQGRYKEAAEHLEQALTLFRAIGHRVGEAHALGYLGGVRGRQGYREQAIKHLEQSLTIFREMGHRIGEAHALRYLGDVYQRQGRWKEAEAHLEQASAIFPNVGDRVGEADVLASLGNVHRQQGRYQQAVDDQQRALALYREIGHPAGEAGTLNNLGEILYDTGQLREALIQHTAALKLATQINDRYEQARAHSGIANSHHATSHSDLARHHWKQALALYAGLDIPDADDIRTHMDALDQTTVENDD